MYTNISNIIDMVMEIIELNRGEIDAIVQQYEPGKVMTVWKGMRRTLPVDAFPSLEIEPSSGSTNWNTVYTQSPEYTLDFTLTTNTNNDAMSVEYIGTLARMLTELFNNPANMAVNIPHETSWLPNQGYVKTRIQSGFVDSITYNATKDGLIRVAQWSWTCKVLEGIEQSWRDNDGLEETVFNPHELPPLL